MPAFKRKSALAALKVVCVCVLCVCELIAPTTFDPEILASVTARGYHF